MDIKARRKALGWSRKDLGARAYVDTRTLQLIELGHSADDESVARCTATLDAAENGREIPDWKARIEAEKGAQTRVGDLPGSQA